LKSASAREGRNRPKATAEFLAMDLGDLHCDIGDFARGAEHGPGYLRRTAIGSKNGSLIDREIGNAGKRGLVETSVRPKPNANRAGVRNDGIFIFPSHLSDKDAIEHRSRFALARHRNRWGGVQSAVVFGKFRYRAIRGSSTRRIGG
jgi:hypothetical protein